MYLMQYEKDTILAALRLYQDALLKGHVPEGVKVIAEWHHKPLNAVEIDKLCQKINA